MQILYHFFSFICFFFNQNDANIPSKSNLLNPRFYRTQTAPKPHLNREHGKWNIFNLLRDFRDPKQKSWSQKGMGKQKNPRKFAYVDLFLCCE